MRKRESERLAGVPPERSRTTTREFRPRTTRRFTMSAAPPVKNRQLYIDGQWCDSASGKKLAVENPATEETIAEVSSGGREDCKKAVAAASEAMKSWMKLTAYDRAKVLKKTADLMRERADA